MKYLKIKKILNKNLSKKGKQKVKDFLSKFKFLNIKNFSSKEFFIDSRNKVKEKIINLYDSKIKTLPEKEFYINGRKTLYRISTTYQKFIEKLVKNLVNEEGSEIWSGLSQSQKWSGILIWTFVGVTSFGVVWSFFTMIDDTIQVTGKLEPKGTTIDVKVPLGGVIKKILVTEGEVVKDTQILLELDTRAAKSKLQALETVRSQIMADILLSKIQLGDNIDTNQLTDNQKIKLNSLKSEYASRIDAANNAVDQATYRRNSNIEQINTLKEVLKIREEVLQNLKELIEIGGLSKVKYLK